MRVRASGFLRVGLDPSYPPFGSYDGSGQIDGLDVDVARAIAARLGVDAALVALDGGGLLDAVLARKCDVAVGIPPARELLKDFRYSKPYFDSGQVLVRKASPAKRVSDVTTIGVEAGSEADLRWQRIAGALGGASPRRLPTLEDLLAMLSSDEVDGVLLDAVAARRAVGANPALIVASAPLTHEPIVVAAHKDDARLLQEIDAILATLASTGELSRLTDKWLR